MPEELLEPKAAFTTVNPTFNREIITPAWVALPSRQIKDCKFFQYNALWDTGATNSVITPQVVKNLGLIPVGAGDVQHAGGISRVNNYLITLVLPNKVIIPNIKVGECAEQRGRFDMIVGMDIISLGDFTISGQAGKRMVSFSIPAAFSVDYVKLIKQTHKPSVPEPNVSVKPDEVP